MNENRRKWLMYLQSKGIKFNEYHDDLAMWLENSELLDFTRDLDCYRIPAQSIPDIPDWRELCREMQSKGVKFEMQDYDREWVKWRNGFSFSTAPITKFRIPQQPLPEWIEEMTEETKQDPREEIPHRELQIQWHEDMLHHLRTGEPMTVWEFRFKVAKEKSGWLKFGSSEIPAWDEGEEYRRKPRTVKYWHCVARAIIDEDEGPCNVFLWSTTSMDDMEREINIMKRTDSAATFTTIIETTAELAD